LFHNFILIFDLKKDCGSLMQKFKMQHLETFKFGSVMMFATADGTDRQV
jgi:hypothetical protein